MAHNLCFKRLSLIFNQEIKVGVYGRNDHKGQELHCNALSDRGKNIVDLNRAVQHYKLPT